MDCRFNRTDLSARVRRVANYKNRISIYNEDAEVFMDRIEDPIPKTAVMYIDLPYYEKDSQLYKNSYRKHDHDRIAHRISKLPSPWLMTYDNVVEISSLYAGYDSVELDIGYSVQTKRRGSEIMIASEQLKLPVDNTVSAH